MILLGVKFESNISDVLEDTDPRDVDVAAVDSRLWISCLDSRYTTRKTS